MPGSWADPARSRQGRGLEGAGHRLATRHRRTNAPVSSLSYSSLLTSSSPASLSSSPTALPASLSASAPRRFFFLPSAGGRGARTAPAPASDQITSHQIRSTGAMSHVFASAIVLLLVPGDHPRNWIHQGGLLRLRRLLMLPALSTNPPLRCPPTMRPLSCPFRVTGFHATPLARCPLFYVLYGSPV